MKNFMLFNRLRGTMILFSLTLIIFQLKSNNAFSSPVPTMKITAPIDPVLSSGTQIDVMWEVTSSASFTGFSIRILFVADPTSCNVTSDISYSVDKDTRSDQILSDCCEEGIYTFFLTGFTNSVTLEDEVTFTVVKQTGPVLAPSPQCTLRCGAMGALTLQVPEHPDCPNCLANWYESLTPGSLAVETGSLSHNVNLGTPPQVGNFFVRYTSPCGVESEDPIFGNVSYLNLLNSPFTTAITKTGTIYEQVPYSVDSCIVNKHTLGAPDNEVQKYSSSLKNALSLLYAPYYEYEADYSFSWDKNYRHVRVPTDPNLAAIIDEDRVCHDIMLQYLTFPVPPGTFVTWTGTVSPKFNIKVKDYTGKVVLTATDADLPNACDITIEQDNVFWVGLQGRPAPQTDNNESFPLNLRMEQDNVMLSVYPNPSTEILNLHCKLINEAEGKVVIMNTIGQIVVSEELPRGSESLSISTQNLQSGLYFATLITGNTNSEVVSFCIMK